LKLCERAKRESLVVTKVNDLLSVVKKKQQKQQRQKQQQQQQQQQQHTNRY
jgi:hypothetical protein